MYLVTANEMKAMDHRTIETFGLPGRILMENAGRGAAAYVDMMTPLGADVAAIDERLNAQLNAILHDPAFQRLEASWRGLHFLVDGAAGQPGVKVRVLNLAWPELVRDLDRAIEFDQS